jgi:exodeoxyribonuclease-1
VQPRLYDFVFRHRGKEQAATLLRLGAFEPVVHVSGKYPAERHCLAVVVAIAEHPTNRNGTLVYDLGVDPSPLIDLDVEEIRRRVFTAAAALGEGRPRIPLKVVHLNRCPVLAPIKVLRSSDYLRLGLDEAVIFRHLDRIRRMPGLARKVSFVFEEAPALSDEADPDALLYRGGFLRAPDREALERLRAKAPEEWAVVTPAFADQRLPEMVFRFRARNYPETLTAAETARWEAYRVNRLTAANRSGIRVFSDYERTIDELEGAETLADRERKVLVDVRAYGRQLLSRSADFLSYT